MGKKKKVVSEAAMKLHRSPIFEADDYENGTIGKLIEKSRWGNAENFGKHAPYTKTGRCSSRGMRDIQDIVLKDGIDRKVSDNDPPKPVRESVPSAKFMDSSLSNVQRDARDWTNLLDKTGDGECFQGSVDLVMPRKLRRFPYKRSDVDSKIDPWLKKLKLPPIGIGGVVENTSCGNGPTSRKDIHGNSEDEFRNIKDERIEEYLYRDVKGSKSKKYLPPLCRGDPLARESPPTFETAANVFLKPVNSVDARLTTKTSADQCSLMNPDLNEKLHYCKHQRSKPALKKDLKKRNVPESRFGELPSRIPGKLIFKAVDIRQTSSPPINAGKAPDKQDDCKRTTLKIHQLLPPIRKNSGHRLEPRLEEVPKPMRALHSLTRRRQPTKSFADFKFIYNMPDQFKMRKTPELSPTLSSSLEGEILYKPQQYYVKNRDAVKKTMPRRLTPLQNEFRIAPPGDFQLVRKVPLPPIRGTDELQKLCPEAQILPNCDDASSEITELEKGVQIQQQIESSNEEALDHQMMQQLKIDHTELEALDEQMQEHLEIDHTEQSALDDPTQKQLEVDQAEQEALVEQMQKKPESDQAEQDAPDERLCQPFESPNLAETECVSSSYGHVSILPEISPVAEADQTIHRLEADERAEEGSSSEQSESLKPQTPPKTEVVFSENVMSILAEIKADAEEEQRRRNRHRSKRSKSKRRKHKKRHILKRVLTPIMEENEDDEPALD